MQNTEPLSDTPARHLPRLSEEAMEFYKKNHDLNGGGMRGILDQGWSEYILLILLHYLRKGGLTRSHSAVQFRRSKASAPYSTVDNVSEIWSSKPIVREDKPKTNLIYINESIPTKVSRNSQGVAAALDYTKGVYLDNQPKHQRVQYEVSFFK